VIKNRTIKYKSRMGQNTGTSNIAKNVIPVPIRMALEHPNQNLNSGNLRAKGLKIKTKCKTTGLLKYSTIEIEINYSI
jgi:hypothetical protein